MTVLAEACSGATSWPDVALVAVLGAAAVAGMWIFMR